MYVCQAIFNKRNSIFTFIFKWEICISWLQGWKYGIISWDETFFTMPQQLNVSYTLPDSRDSRLLLVPFLLFPEHLE